MKSAVDIIEQYLEDNCYDGLFNEDGECGCELGDLAPCGELRPGCYPGVFAPCDCGGYCRWHIVRRKSDQ